MTLSLYDTLHREKRVFTPRDPERVTLYVCGPTVYDFAHIGNARPPVVFDVLTRLLRREYGADSVIYARNVTDVDDKINQKAFREGVEIGEVTARYEAAYLADMAALNVTPPDLTPHVTDHMDAIVAQIGQIIDAGCAYAAEGHVLFDVSAYPAYGALSGRNLDDMIAGARVEVAPYKKNAHDFVLWKPSKENEPSWPSPWGAGRPGWHIECSAMIEETLGLPIDIHGGGIDLVFPHHENEIAQGVCAHGHAHADHAPAEYSRYWMHNGFLTVDAEKMSKSIGNVLLLHDLVQHVPGEVVRWALLSAHYRQPLDWNQSLLDQSKKNLDRLYGALYRARSVKSTGTDLPVEFRKFIEDDLNTPGAMAALFNLSSEIERGLTEGDLSKVAEAKGQLLACADILGVLQAGPEVWLGKDAISKSLIGLAKSRDKAKRAREFQSADVLRDRLARLWTSVSDTADGPQLSYHLSEADLEVLAKRAIERLWGTVEASSPVDGVDFWAIIGDRRVAIEVKRTVPKVNDLRRYMRKVSERFGDSTKVIFAFPFTPENQQIAGLKANMYRGSEWSFVLFDGRGQIRTARFGEWS